MIVPSDEYRRENLVQLRDPDTKEHHRCRCRANIFVELCGFWMCNECESFYEKDTPS